MSLIKKQAVIIGGGPRRIGGGRGTEEKRNR